MKFTDSERESLKKLGNKEFLLSKEDKLCAGLSLVDIMFAYAYNHRTTLGENSVESAWTINKLSPTLSWFAVSSWDWLLLLYLLRFNVFIYVFFV